MEKMCYKTFVWPHNPHTYQEVCVREPVYEKNEAKEDVFQGMGPLKRTITGSGVFFGETAAASYQALAKLFEETSAGNLAHPVWGSRYCYFAGLELTQEPKDNYVSYRFTFLQADADGKLPK